MNYKIKLTTGFREDQYYTIDIQEAHKAYYLFNHPDERGTFKNGVAIRGMDIRSIEPNWNAIMGYNPTYKLESEDWNEIRGKGIDTKVRDLLTKARDIAKLENPPKDILEKPLLEAIKLLPEKPKEIRDATKLLVDKFKI